MKLLSELNDDELLIIEREHYDPIIMDKIEFMKSHYFLDDEDVKVSLAKETYANFDLYYALECIEDDKQQDWYTSYTYTFSCQLYKKDTHAPVNMEFFSDWTIDQVEEFVERLFQNGELDYYETWDEC